MVILIYRYVNWDQSFKTNLAILVGFIQKWHWFNIMGKIFPLFLKSLPWGLLYFPSKSSEGHYTGRSTTKFFMKKNGSLCAFRCNQLGFLKMNCSDRNILPVSLVFQSGVSELWTFIGWSIGLSVSLEDLFWPTLSRNWIFF